MKRPFLWLGWLVLLGSRSIPAQDPVPSPAPASLLDCGGEKVVLFDNTISDDGRYALGWTLRPKAGKPPVDWSGYRAEDGGTVYEKYSFDNEDPAKDDYLLVNGVVDLCAKTFTLLPSKNPYPPRKNHWSISALWSGNQHSKRYGFAAIDARFSTADLWLVTIDAKGVRVRDLTPAADKAVRDYMRKRDPKDYQQYEAIYNLGGSDGTAETHLGFGPGSVTLHFYAGIGKSEVNQDDGFITFALPQGTVTKVRKK